MVKTFGHLVRIFCRRLNEAGGQVANCAWGGFHGRPSYDVDNGELISVNTTYSDIKVPLEFIQSEEEEGQEIRRAKLYITPDLIGDNQVTFQDKIKLTYDGQLRTAQIYDINTKKGSQVYLYIVMVRF